MTPFTEFLAALLTIAAKLSVVAAIFLAVCAIGAAANLAGLRLFAGWLR